MENQKQSSTKLGIQYSVPAFLSGMLAQMENAFFIFFLTNIALLSTAAMAKVTSIGAGLIAVSSLFSGVIMQMVKFKKGRFRPWLIYGGIGIVIGRFMQFTTLKGASEGALVVWFTVGYVLMNFAFAFTSNSYNALCLDIAPDNDTRVKISSWKAVASNIMKLIFGAVAVGFIAKFSNPATGYGVFGNITGILTLAGYIYLYVISKNSNDAKMATEENVVDNAKVNIWEMIKYTFGNMNTILFLLAMWCKVASSLLIAFSTAYYYTYTAQNMGMMSFYLTLSSFVTIIGAFLTPFVAKLFKGVRNTYGCALIAYCVIFVLAFVLKANAVVVTVLLSINQFFWGVYQSAEMPLFMGVIDYTEYKTGKNLTAFMMAVWTFSIKVGIIIANASLAFGLLKIGFEATAVTEAAVAKIPVIVFLFPAAFALLGAVFTFLIPLTDEKITEYRALNAANKTK